MANENINDHTEQEYSVVGFSKQFGCDKDMALKFLTNINLAIHALTEVSLEMENHTVYDQPDSEDLANVVQQTVDHMDILEFVDKLMMLRTVYLYGAIDYDALCNNWKIIIDRESQQNSRNNRSDN